MEFQHFDDLFSYSLFLQIIKFIKIKLVYLGFYYSISIREYNNI
jgi:hypothetical protein